MKKITVIFGITVLSLALFLNTKSIKDTDSNLSLSNLMLVSNASTEGSSTVTCYDPEHTGGSLRKRWCSDCTFQDVTLTDKGTCTFYY